MSEQNYDERLINVLNANIDSKVLKLDNAYEFIKKVIGDIDDKN